MPWEKISGTLFDPVDVALFIQDRARIGFPRMNPKFLHSPVSGAWMTTPAVPKVFVTEKFLL
jgi:hypothetical protein